MAGDLTRDGVVGEVAEPAGVDVAGLLGHFAVVQGASVDTWRGSRLHASAFEAQVDELLGDPHGGTLACATASKLLFSNVQQPVQKGSVGEHHRLGADLHSESCFDPNATATFREDANHTVLPKIKVGRALEHFSPGLGEEVAVVLSPRAPHGGALGFVQHAELNGAAVGHEAGVPAKGIDLSNDLSFGDASHGGVARHLPNDPHVHGDQEGGGAQIGCCCRGFVAGVSGADHNHIVRLNHRRKGREERA